MAEVGREMAQLYRKHFNSAEHSHPNSVTA